MGISALRGTKPWLQVDFLFRCLDAKNYKRCQELMKHLEDFVRVVSIYFSSDYKKASLKINKPLFKMITTPLRYLTVYCLRITAV